MPRFTLYSLLFCLLCLPALSRAQCPGNAAPGEISGTVYLESGLPDGQRQAQETGVAGVLVLLRDAAGTLVNRSRTSTDGSYRFSGLVDGTHYRVQIGELPPGYRLPPYYLGQEDAPDGHEAPCEVALGIEWFPSDQ